MQSSDFGLPSYSGFRQTLSIQQGKALSVKVGAEEQDTAWSLNMENIQLENRATLE